MVSLNWTLSKHYPGKMDSFMLYGFSAGGLGVFTWLETIKSIVLKTQPQAKV
jgi:hypothetical protein